MRKLITWAFVTLGIAALVRRLRRSHHPSSGAVEAPPEEADDPAGDLRRKLDEQRAADEPAAASHAESVDERRTDVHEHGRAALAEMQDSDDR